jgi:lytic murein transglycosylase
MYFSSAGVVFMKAVTRLAGFIFCLLWFAPVEAATCRDLAGFDSWLGDFKRQAAADGISPSAISALDGITYDPGIVAKDHGQHVFRQSFEQFSGRMVNSYRLHKGQALIKQHASTFARIEQQYGVPAPVIVAIWGLETDFGAVQGSSPTLRALATLAYDCRRSDMFQAELMDALRLIQRGDLSPNARGAWAGEVGQTQFMPSNYLKFAVDFSDDGRRDLIHSVPDVLASTANFLRSYGWQRGGSWEPGSANFAVIKEWNKADVYSRTIAYFATRLASGE